MLLLWLKLHALCSCYLTVAMRAWCLRTWNRRLHCPVICARHDSPPHRALRQLYVRPCRQLHSGPVLSTRSQHAGWAPPDIDPEGNLIDPIRVEWASGGIFTTPPGWWHSHHNDTDDDAWVLPIQACTPALISDSSFG